MNQFAPCNYPLTPEIVKQRRAIIGIVGLAGSGKSTLEDLIRCRHDFAVETLAAPLKMFCASVFGFDSLSLYGPSEYRNAIDPRWGFSARRALQFIGTEVARGLHPDVWVRSLISRIELRGLKRYVVSDVRFQNEIDALKAVGGKIVMIRRPGVEQGEHASERADELTGIDFVLNNDSTVEALAERADAIVSEVLS